MSEIDTDTLAHLMHDLGYIVHYSDDEKLRDDVMLKPEWLTKAIGFVLEDRATQDAEGILPDESFVLRSGVNIHSKTNRATTPLSIRSSCA